MATCLASGRSRGAALRARADAAGGGARPRTGDVYGAAMQAASSAIPTLRGRFIAARAKGRPAVRSGAQHCPRGGRALRQAPRRSALLDERAARDGGGGALAGGGGARPLAAGCRRRSRGARCGLYDAVLKPLMMERRDEEMLRRFDRWVARGSGHSSRTPPGDLGVRKPSAGRPRRCAAAADAAGQPPLPGRRRRRDVRVLPRGHPDLAHDIFESVRREVPASAAAADARGADRSS